MSGQLCEPSNLLLLQGSSKKMNGKRDRQKANRGESRPDTWSHEPKKQKLVEAAQNSCKPSVTVQAGDDTSPVERSTESAQEVTERAERQLDVPPTES